MPKTDNGSSASTWRRNDKKYREQQKARRKANTERRIEVAAAAEMGVTVEQYRKAVKEELI